MQSDLLWQQYLQEEVAYRRQNLQDEDFWARYDKLVKKSQKRQPRPSPPSYPQKIVNYDYQALYTFHEFGRLYAILNGSIFSFCFLFIFSAMLSKSLLVGIELYLLLIPLCLLAGVFFARSFKTCQVTSNLLIIRHPWMLINKTFVLHHIQEVTIDDDPNGYWFLKINTHQESYNYSVNINYCKLKKLLDFLGENQIKTYDKISLTV
ncbi:MAG TPA: hypothetical protein DCS93_03060 [Microscillaceae bacterium]|nr:hypothetical protein [Microscillaceae bacterium]